MRTGNSLIFRRFPHFAIGTSFLGKEEWLHTEVATTGMAAVMSAMDTVIQLMNKCWELMTSNPLLALCVAAGLLPIGISIFAALRNAARG